MKILLTLFHYITLLFTSSLLAFNYNLNGKVLLSAYFNLQINAIITLTSYDLLLWIAQINVTHET